MGRRSAAVMAVAMIGAIGLTGCAKLTELAPQACICSRTCVAASAAAITVASSRAGMRSTAPFLRRLMLLSMKASGLARRIASIIWLTVTESSGRARVAIDQSVSPLETGP